MCGHRAALRCSSALLLLQLLCPCLLLAPCTALQTRCEGLRTVKGYNKIFGTHQIAPRYTFQPSKHPIVEGAERLLAAGFTSFKFDMQSHPATSHKMAEPATPQSATLLQNMMDPTLPNLAILDMPFQTFMFWLRGAGDHRLESYDLASFLIRRYRHSNKTFMLGTWKTDYFIRDWTGVGTALNPHPNATTRILQHRLAAGQAAWQAQQAGVDAARKKLAHLMQGVQVYSYLEVNLVRNGTVRYSVIEDVVPKMRPPPDYISLSLSTLPQYIMSPDPQVVSRRLHPLLDRIAAQLPPKKGVPGPRVFIGEFEFPLRNKYGQIDGDSWTAPTQELQAKHALATLAAAIAWGTPHVMWWELYDNTKVFTKDGRDKAELGVYEDRGFCLVDHNNRDSVLYKSIQQYIKQANAWLCAQQQAKPGGPLCRDDFRSWAVNTLVALSNEIGTTRAPPTKQFMTGKPMPLALDLSRHAVTERGLLELTGRTSYRAPTVTKRGCFAA